MHQNRFALVFGLKRSILCRQFHVVYVAAVSDTRKYLSRITYFSLITVICNVNNVYCGDRRICGGHRVRCGDSACSLILHTHIASGFRTESTSRTLSSMNECGIKRRKRKIANLKRRRKNARQIFANVLMAPRLDRKKRRRTHEKYGK